jgi:lipopolysaccharide/colanic/teichoic acid biosynthesis glycosyltransferase
MAAAALAVRTDTRGPVLFAQERVGLGGRTFRILKLRTMVVDNDDSEHAAYVAALITGRAHTREGVYKLVGDSRITRVGRFLRRYSIDELPQLWNVLRGDMSLVGPRPALPREVALYDGHARRRLAVKPGLTGLWQVSGRCELSFVEMVDLDIAYGRDWSLLSDVRILLKTPAAALTGRGAA